MSDGSSLLTEEDVQRLARLIESLESSTFDYMQLQIGDMKVTIGKGAVHAHAVGVSEVGAPAGTIVIKSHIMGMFYPQPEPGSPPFVSLGAEVNEDTTVCLIEVMKTFNAMTAGVKGVITEICVQNAQLVEYGQVLFRVRPS